MEMSGKFADRLKEAIRAKGCSYEALAGQLGISTKTLGRYVQGQRVPRMDLAADIARALDADPMWLQGLDAPERAEPEETAASDSAERLLLANYRALSPHGRAKAVAYTAALVGMFPAERARPAVSDETAQADFVPASGTFPAVEVLRKEISQEKAEQIAADACGGDLELLGLRRTSNVAIVNLAAGSGLGGDGLLSRICLCTADIVAGFFAQSSLKTVSCFFRSQPAGGETGGGEILVKIIVSRTSDALDDGEFRKKVAADYNALLRMADEYFIHPELKTELRSLRP